MQQRKQHKGKHTHKVLMILVLAAVLLLSLAVWYYFQQQISHLQALPLGMPWLSALGKP